MTGGLAPNRHAEFLVGFAPPCAEARDLFRAVPKYRRAEKRDNSGIWLQGKTLQLNSGVAINMRQSSRE